MTRIHKDCGGELRQNYHIKDADPWICAKCNEGFTHAEMEVMSDEQMDPVNHPSHYTAGGIECIDAIRAALTPEEFRGFCKGNALKYVWREQLKGRADEDIEKARWYLQRLLP